MEEKEKNLTGFKKFKTNLKEFHTKKPYIEFFTALLTIPVLITVIYLNINNIKGENKKDEVKNEEKAIVITQPESNSEEKKEIITKEACKPGIGNVSISSPDEGENISDNPVYVDIDYDANGYCNIVWSYRINNGQWSSFDDRSIALFNLQEGDINLDLRIKSVVNTESNTLTRRFQYINEINTQPSENPTLSPAPTQ